MKKILISTGGSGGHVIPAIALFDHYRENFEIYLVSDRRGAKYIDQNKYSFEIIDIPKISNNIFLKYYSMGPPKSSDRKTPWK